MFKLLFGTEREIEQLTEFCKPLPFSTFYDIIEVTGTLKLRERSELA
jgi:hypothetical protein